MCTPHRITRCYTVRYMEDNRVSKNNGLGQWTSEPVDCCPICLADGKFMVTAPVQVDDIRVSEYLCNDCGVMYHNPRMTKESMDTYYNTGEYVKHNKPNNFGERFRAMTRVTLISSFSNLPKPKRALDVGCAQGFFLERLKDWSYEVDTVGYDLFMDPNALREIVNKKSDITGTFDFISCIHVLEHMNNPLSELTWMDSLLDDGGTLFLELPIIRNVMLDHPVTFTAKSVPFLMDHISMEHFTTVEREGSEVIMVLGRKV